MSVASVNGINISYIIHRPPSHIPSKEAWVVLINGLADEKESWAYQIEDLTHAGHVVLALDNRGIGKTSAPPGPYTSSVLAADTKALINHLSVKHFHVVGVSMGGMIAQEFALTYPDGLLSVTLACTYAAPGPFCSRMFDMWADTAPVMGVPHVMRNVLLWCFTVPFFRHGNADLDAIEESMKTLTMSTEAYLAQLNVIQHFDTTGRLHQLPNVPTMVLAGEEDILIPVSLSRKLHELIPHSRWRTVKGGHGCCWEFAEQFNKAVTEFLDEAESKIS